jgi:alpha-glucosidase
MAHARIGVFAILLGSCFVCGQVLFQESFTHEITTEDSSKARLVEGNLNFRYHREIGGRIRIQDHNQGIVFPIDLSVWEKAESPRTVYLSFVLASLNVTCKDRYGGLFLYRDQREQFGLGNDYASEYFSFWGSDGKGIPIGQIPTPVDDQVHMIVMRITENPEGRHKIRIWLDPICSRSEDRQPPNLWTDYEYELDFNQIRLRVGAQSCTWEFDEILLGTTWASVTPSDQQAGDYINRIVQRCADPEKEELIGDRIARFWPVGADQSGLPSFVLEKPRQATGPIPSQWLLKPRFSQTDNRQFVYLELPPEVDLYGTGEVTGRLLRNGCKIELYNKDNYCYGKPDQLYQSHPWVMGVRQDGSAFGVIFDTPWMARLDLREGILFSVPEEAPPFPVLVIEADDPGQAMSKLVDLTGPMPMPPLWALGYQQCRYSYYPDSRVREIADTFRAKQIPCDVIWMDIDYMDGFRIFTFDPNRFPNPKQANDYLHSLGFKSVWMIDPGVKNEPGYFVYDSGSAQDIWVQDALGRPFVGPVWPGDCVFPDFTMPQAAQWWANLYQSFLACGIDGIWNDMNEPAVFKGDWTMPPDCRHRGGGDLPAGPHIQYHNVYGLLMAKATRQGIQAARPTKRPFVLSRANFLGGHRYAAAWTGDNAATWQHLKWSIPMSLNLGLSGQPFNGPDIGGFAGSADAELWAHWISVGAFYPFSRAHTTKGSDDQEPWSFGPRTESAARIALQRRYRLLPYLYTLFYESHRTGLPIMRPTLMADSKDLALRMEDQAFLLGSDLLVIPRWAVRPALPGGIWRQLSLVEPEGQPDPHQCDLKIRGGAIVPLGKIVQNTADYRLEELTLAVCLDEMGTGRGILYEDAGDGYEYLDGMYRLSEYTARRQENQVRIRVRHIDGQMEWCKRKLFIEMITDNGVIKAIGDEQKENFINL